MGKLSKKQKFIVFISMLIFVVILTIIIITNIIKRNRGIANESYLSTANAYSNLVAGYIKNGITIGGITGTLEIL